MLFANIAQRSYRRVGIGFEGRWEQDFPDQFGLLPEGEVVFSPLFLTTDLMVKPNRLQQQKAGGGRREHSLHHRRFSGSMRRDFSLNSLHPSTPASSGAEQSLIRLVILEEVILLRFSLWEAELCRKHSPF